MISFDNTEIAFKPKSDKDLQRAYLMFQAMRSNILVKTGNFFAKLATGSGLPVGWAVKPTIYKHFVGGETIEECKPAIDVLGKYNVKSILDYSVEGGGTPEKIEHTLEETLKTIDNAAQDPNIPFAVFKPTAFTSEEILEKASAGDALNEEEEMEADRFIQRVNMLCEHAFKKKVPIMIDAEDFRFQQFIDEVVTEMMVYYNKEKAIVFNTLQMYRTDRLDFLKESLQQAEKGNYFLGIKFVRGAYMERERRRANELGYPSPIHPDKESTDRAYNDALKFSVEHIDRISIFNGTHNEFSSAYLLQLMENHKIAKNDPRIYNSQLYGMSDHISFNLAHHGYNVAKYVPYGPVKSVLPYLLRRVEENTSIAGQTSRELRLIIAEKQRREHIR